MLGAGLRANWSRRPRRTASNAPGKAVRAVRAEHVLRGGAAGEKRQETGGGRAAKAAFARKRPAAVVMASAAGAAWEDAEEQKLPRVMAAGLFTNLG